MRWPVELAKPDRYHAQLIKLHARYGGTRQAHDIQQAGVELAMLFQDQGPVSRKLARTVAAGQYQLSAGRAHFAVLDKPREIFSFDALDLVLHGVIGQLLNEEAERVLSTNVWSYRPRLSSWSAVRHFATHIREHRRRRHDPRQRGLFVLRGDVRRYIETIPVGARSPLWPELRQLTGLDETAPEWRLVEGVVRPLLVDEDGQLSMRIRGIPMGSPAANPILNLYLRPLDEALDLLGGFYVRYGDDLIFAHEELELVQKGALTIDRVLMERQLSLNAAKRQVLYLTASGRPADNWPEARGTQQVTFLGMRVGADGTIGLPRPKWHRLLSDLRARITHSRALIAELTVDERASALCALINEALEPSSELAHGHAVLLRSLVTDRRQLGELDHHIWLAIAQAATGKKGPRALRELSPERMREAHGLRSLVAQRNREP